MTPRLYVGTYKKYNEGSIQGAWLDLENYTDKDEFMEACSALHADESDPEFMFQDREDIPTCFVSECSIDAEFWDFMDYDDRYDGEAKTAFVDWQGEWDSEKFEEAFQGKFDSEVDYAYDYVESCGLLSSMPENLQCYFDYERFARDLFICDLEFLDGFVFYNQ